MYCEQCGGAFSDNLRFCPQCGMPRQGMPVAASPPSPVRAPMPAPPPVIQTAGAYKSPSALARAIVILLVIGAVFHVIGIVSTMAQMSLLSNVKSGVTLGPGAASANDLRQQIIGAVQVLVFIVTAVLFLTWISRVYRNLTALSTREPTHSPGWAVGAWFVPFLNLFRPVQIVKEVWIYSDPTATEYGGLGIAPSAPPLIGWWWGLYLVTGFFGQITFRLSASAKTIDDLLASSTLSIVGDVLGIPLTILAFQVVRKLSARQDAAARGEPVGV